MLAVVFLLLSYLSKHVSPETFWPIAFFGLAFPVLVVINLIFILFWAIKKKWYFLISLIALVLGFQNLNAYFKLPLAKNGDLKNKVEANSFKVLSYNVRLFNLYQWENAETESMIFNFLEGENPSIICFQEFYTREKGFFTKDDLFNRLSSTPHKHIKYHTRNSTRNYGMATFSAYPIINMGNIVFGNSANISIFTDIVLFNDTIRVYNVHLQSIKLNAKNYTLLDSLKQLNYSEKHVSEIKDISYRLHEAFIRRAKQVDVISEHVKSSPHPVIVCGDFNDTPVSYAYRQMSKGLKDAFVESGTGFGNTYSGNFPSFRIDYILHGPELSSIAFEREKIRLSDHYPIYCTIFMPGNL
jgi:endonuclease/exonuclease/phosphatase family metal-dependent hydrolase